MTFEELKEKAKEIFEDRCDTSSELIIGISFENYELYFRKDGSIDVEFPIGIHNVGGLDISEERTYEQMYQIMLALDYEQHFRAAGR